MIVTVIGTGLIGGSMALSLKEKGLAKKVIGVDANTGHLARAMELGIIDEYAALTHGVKRPTWWCWPSRWTRVLAYCPPS